MKTHEDLQKDGFTESGRNRFTQTLTDYAEELSQRAIFLGEADRGKGMPREVTHDHVRKGAHAIAATFGSERDSAFSIKCQIGEYVCTALAGLSAGHIDKWFGQVGFGLCSVLGLAIFVSRKTKKEI